MDKRMGFILGTVFIIFSGIIYTIERLNSFVYWSGQRIGAMEGGNWETEPTMPSLTDNFFVILFLIISIGFFVWGVMKKE